MRHDAGHRGQRVLPRLSPAARPLTTCRRRHPAPPRSPGTARARTAGPARRRRNCATTGRAARRGGPTARRARNRPGRWSAASPAATAPGRRGRPERRGDFDHPGATLLARAGVLQGVTNDDRVRAGEGSAAGAFRAGLGDTNEGGAVGVVGGVAAQWDVHVVGEAEGGKLDLRALPQVPRHDRRAEVRVRACPEKFPYRHGHRGPRPLRWQLRRRAADGGAEDLAVDEAVGVPRVEEGPVDAPEDEDHAGTRSRRTSSPCSTKDRTALAPPERRASASIECRCSPSLASARFAPSPGPPPRSRTRRRHRPRASVPWPCGRGTAPSSAPRPQRVSLGPTRRLSQPRRACPTPCRRCPVVRESAASRAGRPRPGPRATAVRSWPR